MGKSARIPFIGRKYQRIWIRWENRRPLRALGARQLLARRDFCKIEGLRSTLKKPQNVAIMASKNQVGHARSIGSIKTKTTIVIWTRNLQFFESHFSTVSFWHKKSEIEKPNWISSKFTPCSCLGTELPKILSRHRDKLSMANTVFP